MPLNFDDVLKVASPATRTVSLCLAGELVEQLEILERELADAKPATNLGESPKQAIAEQIMALQEQMRGESTVAFRIRAMHPKDWATYWMSRPEREMDDDGKFTESAEAFAGRIWPFWVELVARSCIDPVMTVEQVDELAGLLSGGDWLRLTSQCQDINAGRVDVPNSAAASVLTLISEQT